MSCDACPDILASHEIVAGENAPYSIGQLLSGSVGVTVGINAGRSRLHARRPRRENECNKNGEERSFRHVCELGSGKESEYGASRGIGERRRRSRMSAQPAGPFALSFFSSTTRPCRSGQRRRRVSGEANATQWESVAHRPTGALNVREPSQ